ncbi:hypothetical protein ACN42_g5716 [Penicillium freii]|uniref:Uncharacterized protein n=1 Tax=Penicillium freii TaxID=48697 RepID=A0A117NNV9_PENFR|nr:hypothetical protein ACN42_g5716 [Penicillium freii]
MSIESMLYIPKIRSDPGSCPKETSNSLTPKLTVQPGSTHSKQVQLSDLSHVSSTTTNETSHISNHNGQAYEYHDEELWFIWYKRAALDQEWNDLLESFNRQFPERQISHGQTLQAGYYRLIESLRLLGEKVSTETIIHRANLSYSWISTHSKQVQSSDLPGVSLATTSSNRPIRNARKKGFKPQEIWFIWWKRVALNQGWSDILKSFNCQFPNRQRDSTAGMSFKLKIMYRNGELPSRYQIGAKAGTCYLNKAMSFVNQANLRYPWLLKDLETALPSCK